MAFSLVLLEKLISMMLMALVGYILVKTGILGQPDSRVISLLLVYVLQPCLVLRSLQIELTPDRLHGFIFGGIFASLTMVFPSSSPNWPKGALIWTVSTAPLWSTQMSGTLQCRS